MDYHKSGMRTPISRFAAYTGGLDRAMEGYPTVQPAAREPGPATATSAIERRHPAVSRALTLLWGHPEMNQYFEKVWSGNDPSLHLEPDAMAELMLLAAVHQRICPFRPAKKVEELYGDGRWADTWKPARLRR
jgi:hypothetical protein